MTKYVVVEGRALARAMKTANDVIERRSTIPILNCVKLTYGTGGLAISGTDLDMEIKLQIDEIEGAGEWSICLDASNLEKIASVAGVTKVRIEPTTRQVTRGSSGTYDQNGATITLGDHDAVYEIDYIQPASDWPLLGNNRAARIERFTNGMFATTLRKVAWAISTEETRYYLNGVCWQVYENGRRFVATDGHRLALCRYDSESGERQSRIIPRKAVACIIKHFDGLDIEVYATDNPGIIDIVAPGLLLRTKLIDGTFPDVDRVIPQTEAIKTTLDLKRDEITIAIKQATAVGGTLKGGPAIRFHGIDGRLNIERRNVDFGTAKVRTSTEWPEDTQPFGFNGRYMLEIVDNCQGTITLGVMDERSPFLVADNDDTMTRVIMPMRV